MPVFQDDTGDNKEITIASTGNITLYFQNNSGLTSADDNPTIGNYYLDSNKIRRLITLRTDQSLQILGMNGETYTDPITVAIGDGTIEPASGKYEENFRFLLISSITLNIQTANTNLKLKVV